MVCVWQDRVFPLLVDVPTCHEWAFMHSRILALGLPLLLIGCQSGQNGQQTDPPADDLPSAAIVDGNCSEYPASFAVLDRGVAVFKKEDSDYLWLCFDLPEGSFATGEFVLETPTLTDPLVLHFSAQLGQWPLGNEELRPTGPTSPLWWNIQGWTAVPARFNGTEMVDGEVRPRFLNPDGQELQFEKRHFGPGPWTIRGSFYAVSDGNGGRAPVSLGDSFVVRLAESAGS